MLHIARPRPDDEYSSEVILRCVVLGHSTQIVSCVITQAACNLNEGRNRPFVSNAPVLK